MECDNKPPFSKRHQEGNLYLRIRWDDFDLVDNVRWCGNLLCTEKINLTKGHILRLDQGTTPQVPVARQVIEGKHIFADPTLLEITDGAELSLEKISKLVVKSGSSLLIRKGAIVKLDKKSKIKVKPGGYLFVEVGARILLKGRKTGFKLSEEANRGIHPLLLESLDPLERGASIPSL